MSVFAPHQFFDLGKFEHAAIFDGCDPVWLVLKKISPYLKNHALGQIKGELAEGSYLIKKEQISIGEGTVVEPGAYIEGPCIIGKNCTVRHGAYIRGNFIAGDHCVIGHDTEVKNVIMLSHCHAAHFAYVGDCVLGNRVNLGAGTKCANLKLDGKEVVVHFNDERFPTGLRKFGAIIGDDAQTGCNSVTNPGSLLFKKSKIYPCINWGGVLTEERVAYPSEKPKVR